MAGHQFAVRTRASTAGASPQARPTLIGLGIIGIIAAGFLFNAVQHPLPSSPVSAAHPTAGAAATGGLPATHPAKLAVRSGPPHELTQQASGAAAAAPVKPSTPAAVRIIAPPANNGCPSPATKEISWLAPDPAQAVTPARQRRGGTVAVPPSSTAASAATSTPTTTAPAKPRTKLVALTFDDGPGPQTLSILATLQKYRVRATFFTVGAQVMQHPDIVKQATAQGHMIGSHGWDHQALGSMSPAGQRANLARSASAIYQVTGQWPCWLRPPFGSMNRHTNAAAASQKMTSALWNVDTQDWQAGSARNNAVATRGLRYIATQTGGSSPIVLMHDGPGNRPTTAQMLPHVIQWYHDHGYTFVGLDGKSEPTGASLLDAAPPQASAPAAPGPARPSAVPNVSVPALAATSAVTAPSPHS